MLSSSAHESRLHHFFHPLCCRFVVFVERVFGIFWRLLHASAGRGELEAVEVMPDFASHEIGRKSFPAGFVAASAPSNPLGFKWRCVTVCCRDTRQRIGVAVALEVKTPESKSSGQTVSFACCPDGTLVEICSPFGR